MRTRTACLAAAALAAARAAPAHADTKLGVEIGRTVVGIAGPGVRASFGSFELDALADGYYFDQSLPNHAVRAELRALVPARRWPDGWIGVAVGGAFARATEATPDAVEIEVDGWAVEAGLHAEWFALPSVSLGFDVGVAHEVGHDGHAPFADAGGATALTSIGRPTGGATFTFWF
jgi:hypothetical protein